MLKSPSLRVAIGGFGAIGMRTAEALHAGIEGLQLKAISARDGEAAARRLAERGIEADVLPLAELGGNADIVVECAPASVFRKVALGAIDKGRIFMPLSVGQLLEHDDLIARAHATGARIITPTGALLGLDAVRAAAEGVIYDVTMITRKPLRGLQGAPYLEAAGIDVMALNDATCIFKGSAREGARGFPANVNVAAALALAGVGPDRTKLEIWADPVVERNIHTIKVDADSARFELRIENVPSSENPRTGRITALSTIAALRRLVSTLQVGS